VNGYSSIKGQGHDRREDSGFTLVEILIAIVLVGILSAVVVVGIGSLTNEGSKSACAASLDAAKAGAVVYYATEDGYPLTLLAMTVDPAPSGGPAALELPTGVVVNAADITGPPAVAAGMQAASGTSWQLTMTAGASGAKPTFVCTP
jgi:prepilin-type N-terminal cleavage/methylation domain-containing protein